MFVLLLIFWIILNGKITAEILALGVVIAGAIFWFMCKFLEYSPKYELCVARNIGWILVYFVVLIVEMLKSAVTVYKRVYSRKIEIQPQMVFFNVDLESEFLRIVLANSITLTPGTITVDVDEKQFCVHALDYTLAEGIEDSVFIKLLKKMEDNING
ncbi:MAG: Na+/H+ antiporter subunit E [Oscillospiraceae bacterium]|nr:Na+/H+ antiporter subunit E [Oscillospiraceae bacterium]MBR5306848.1 Na+/H+ antiporter subunit E [Oscillospiraceae bacterium]